MSTDDQQQPGGGDDHGATRKVRPVIMPEVFNGEPSTNWDDWVGHFDSVARVNGWDAPTCLLWLEVRMTGKAQNAWKRLSQEAKADYNAAKAALRKRFEPESRRDLYVVEFQTRRRLKGESWEELGDNLRILADKAFPDLEDKAKEQLSLDRYLHQLDRPELALAVRQSRPKTIDDAVAYTLETESYLTLHSPRDKLSNSTIRAQVEEVFAVESSEPTCNAVKCMEVKQDAIMEMIRTLTIRLDHLEKKVSGSDSGKKQQGKDNPTTSAREPIICHKCGKEGHFARGCAAAYYRLPSSTGN